MKKILITIIIYVFTAKANAQTILLQETFSNGTLPAGWSIDSAGVTPVNGWVFSGNPFPVLGQGFDNNYPRVNGGTWQKRFDCSLVTPLINVSAINSLYLGYSELFTVGGSNGNPNNPNYSIQKIEISNDSGLTWQLAFENSVYHHPYKRQIVNLSPFMIGQQNIKLKFRFTEFDRGTWAIDSIVVADSIYCTYPPDSGVTKCDVTYACTGETAKLWIEDLSQGLAQTYQWQLKNAATGNVWSNIGGAIADSLTVTQNGATYYQCMVTCGGLSTNSKSLLLGDVPPEAYFYSKNRFMICSGRNDTIALFPGMPYGGPGVGYQWRQSTGVWNTYTDIPGATNEYFVVSSLNYSQSTFFQCKQVCLSSGTVSPINVHNFVNEIINPNPLCYCFPSAGNSCFFNNNYLSNVNIAGTTLNYSDGCVDTLQYGEGFTNYVFHDPVLHPNATAILGRGNTYQMEVTNSAVCNAVVLWIDYNNDLVFDTTEMVSPPGTLSANIPFQFSFTVPANAVHGQTGMRIKTFATVAHLSAKNNPCGYNDGNAKDYIVTIDSTVGIADLGIEIGDVRLMPNPAKDKLTITALNFTPTHNAQFIITDLTGRILQQEIFTGTATINTTALTPAVYFVTVKGKERSVVRRFVKAP